MEKHGFRKTVYWITLFLITLSGFAQMPIFKRYYIADIPGLGWLAEFYVTHQIHYITAAILIVLVFYVFTDFFLRRVSLNRLSATALVKIVLIAGLMISGAFMAYKNMSGVFMNHILVNVLDLVHLGLCMLLLMAGLYSMVKKKKWLKEDTN